MRWPSKPAPPTRSESRGGHVSGNGEPAIVVNSAGFAPLQGAVSLKGLPSMKSPSVFGRARTATLTCAVAVALGLPVFALAQNIAIVNGKAVPKSRVDALIEQATRGGQQQRTPELEQQARDEVVMREIFMQEAEKRGLAASAEYKSKMEFARQQILIGELFADYQKKHPVSDTDAKAEYEKIKAANAGTEYRARHILVEDEKEAVDLIGKIKGGANFEELAKKHSKDPGSGAKGGDLDFANPSSFVPEFSQALVALKKGEMTEKPVKTQFGWHVIKLEDTREAQFPSFDEVKPQLVQRLQQQRIIALRDELRAKAKTDYKFSQ
jgi:peptidyl-prolyl cis-trans isomerase C